MDEKTLKAMTVVDLRRELEERGLSPAGTKPVLLKRLKEALDAASTDAPTTSGSTATTTEAATPAAAAAGAAGSAAPAAAAADTATGAASGDAAPADKAAASSTDKAAASSEANGASSDADESLSQAVSSSEDPEIEKKRKRAEKFGIAVVLTDEEKARLRKAKFGIVTDEDKAEARKKRFGIVTDEDKIKKRKERFGDMLGTSLEDVHRAQRLGFPSKKGGRDNGAQRGQQGARGQGGRAQGGRGQQQGRNNAKGGRGNNQAPRITGSKRKEKEPSIATPILSAEDLAKRELRKQRFATDTDAKRQKTQDE